MDDLESSINGLQTVVFTFWRMSTLSQQKLSKGSSKIADQS